MEFYNMYYDGHTIKEIKEKLIINEDN
jgi:hypothetical protein